MTVKLNIQRSNGAYQGYDVEYREGMSLLDALKVAGRTDPDLAYRWECGQGICGVCTATVNGKPQLTCAVLMRDHEAYSVEPLAGFPVEKDLLVEFAPRYEKMMGVEPYLTNWGKPIESKEEADQSKLLRACIECWACVAVCPISLNTDHADALSMVKLARFALDPRDGADRVQMANEHGLAAYAETCVTCRACTDVCPKKIDVYVDAVKVLLDQQVAEKR